MLWGSHLCKADKEVAIVTLREPLGMYTLWALQHSADAPALQHPLQRQLQHNCMRGAGRHRHTIHDWRKHAEGGLPRLACTQITLLEASAGCTPVLPGACAAWSNSSHIATALQNCQMQ